MQDVLGQAEERRPLSWGCYEVANSRSCLSRISVPPALELPAVAFGSVARVKAPPSCRAIRLVMREVLRGERAWERACSVGREPRGEQSNQHARMGIRKERDSEPGKQDLCRIGFSRGYLCELRIPFVPGPCVDWGSLLSRRVIVAVSATRVKVVAIERFARQWRSTLTRFAATAGWRLSGKGDGWSRSERKNSGSAR